MGKVAVMGGRIGGDLPTTEFDSRTFRNVIGNFTTGVTVITTVDTEGGPVGLTANSFSSLSLDPPLVLFCLDRTVSSFDAFQASRHFAINILGAGQQELSQCFARTGSDKWNGVAFDRWSTGCPILKGCIANLECDVDSIHDGGDHVIMVGRVVAMETADDGLEPLTFYRGKYGRNVSA